MDIPLFPLNTVLFPGGLLPLQVFEERYKLMVERCLERDAPFGVVLIRSGQEVGGAAEPFEIGTTARITRLQRLDGGRFALVAAGRQRYRILDLKHDEPYLRANVSLLAEEDEDAPGIEQVMTRVSELFAEYVRLGLAIGNEWSREITLPHRPASLADAIASRIELEPQGKQRLLEELSVPRRLSTERRLLERAVEVLAERLHETRQARYGVLGALN